jgi:hypothetical protein
MDDKAHGVFAMRGPSRPNPNGPKVLLRPDACFWYNEFSDKRSTNLFEVIQPLSSAGERAALFVHAILQNQ